MHEFSIARSICRIALEEAERHGASRITAVCVEVGTMRQVVPELLKTAFEAAGSGTPLEGATLELQAAPVEATCNQCGHVSHCETLQMNCERCDSSDVQFAGGNNLRVNSIRVAEEVCHEH